MAAPTTELAPTELPVSTDQGDSQITEIEIELMPIKDEIIEISDDDSEEKPKKKRKRYTSPPQQCDECNKMFRTGYELKKHKRTHTGERPYMCTYCGKTYTQPGHLATHQLKHKGEKNFYCVKCTMSFYRKADLDRHEKVHSGEKPYQCEICSKSFTQKNNLVMHVKMHTNDRAHACTVCAKRFITKSKLRAHMRKHDKAPYLPPPALPGDKLRLYHVEMNPYGHRVLLILEAKKTKYEVLKLDPLRLPEWFKVKNPRLKIPVLELPTDQGDKYLFESVVICDYLDERYTRNPLHSRDPYVKAQDRLLIERFNELIKGSLECFDTNFAYGSEQILQTLEIFENELSNRGTNYFGGSRPGMLDYMIWPWIERLFLLRCVSETKFEQKRSLFPNFSDWADQMQLDEVVKKHACSPQEYFEYYKNARTHSMGFYL